MPARGAGGGQRVATVASLGQRVGAERQPHVGSDDLVDDRLELRRLGKTAMLPCPADEKMGLSYWGAGHKRCIEDFYRCLPHPETYKNSAASCEDTMQVLLKVYEQNAKVL